MDHGTKPLLRRLPILILMENYSNNSMLLQLIKISHNLHHDLYNWKTLTTDLLDLYLYFHVGVKVQILFSLVNSKIVLFWLNKKQKYWNIHILYINKSL